MYEIFFFDIDGTLRSFETHEVPASAREALARLRGRGAKVIIATGRDRRSLPPLEGLTFDGYILVNGGHCLTTDGEVLAERPIPMEILDRMLHVGMREGFPVSMLTDEGMVASSVNDGMREFLGALGMPLDPAVADLREVAQRTPCRQMCVFMSPEQEERIMREFPECVSSRWSPLMADINMCGVTKASGMDVFLRHYGIDRSRSMAFGDGGNDVAMLSAAGVGVACTATLRSIIARDMALILCIETGTDICSVGIAENGELVSLRESDEGRDHARKVGVFVDEILKENRLDPDDLDAVAVGKGPGSYTGLRIGVSFAKGLCYGLRKPLVAVGSLDALCEVAREDYEAGILAVEDWERAVLCPMVDARRMEVYTQLFDAQGRPLTEVSAEVVDVGSFSTWRAKGPFVIFGSGAAKCADVLSDAVLVHVAPSARGLARLAQTAFDRGDFADLAYFEPFYLKDFVVTTSRKKLF